MLTFVLLGQRSSNASPETVLSAVADADADTLANPLDQVSSADIAVNIARMSGLQESQKIAETANSVEIELALPPASSNIVAKPQVIGTSLKSKKDIQAYVTVSGDTVSDIAAKFGVTSDSIRWSNDLASNTVAIGKTLWIPPLNGIVYVVKAGDTPDSLATKYKASKDEIVAYNDAELTPLKAGDRIIIPNGTIVAPVIAASRVANAGFGWGGAPVYGGNLYTYGYCTWYVANRIAVPQNWGNAISWDEGARASGWTVSSVPRPGAIAQSNRGWEGHVGVVEEVREDGYIKYSDMNGLAGWGRVGYSEWVAPSKYDNYIYR